jgi:hypothetical protein
MNKVNRPAQGVGEIIQIVQNLSHTLVVTNKLQQIPFWVGEV